MIDKLIFQELTDAEAANLTGGNPTPGARLLRTLKSPLLYGVGLIHPPNPHKLKVTKKIIQLWNQRVRRGSQN